MAQASVRHFLDETSFQHAVLDLLKAELQEAASQPHCVLLSGGRTPLPVYAYLAQHPFAVSKSAYIAFSDERHVTVDSPESNYGAAAPMLQALQLLPEQEMRVETELPLEEAATQYEHKINRFLADGGKFSLGLLGIGTDGHTCSLFNDEDLQRAEGRLAIAVKRPAPPHRISVTPDLLAQVARVIILATGAEKEEVVRTLLEAPQQVIAGRAVARCPLVEVWRA